MRHKECAPELRGAVRLPAGRLKAVGGWLQGAGVLLLAASFGGAWWQPKEFFHSWLFSFFFFFSLCAGALFWVLLHYVTNAGWGVLLRRQVENLATLFPWVAFLFLPILWDVFWGHHLYEWTSPALARDPALHAKSAYLNLPFFTIRAVFFFVFWIAAAWFFWNGSCSQDGDGDPWHTVRMQKLSYGLLVIYGACMTFAAIDWLMGLDFRWGSTIWGGYIFVGAAGASLALWILILLWLRGRGYLPQMTEEHLHLLGRLLFAFTALWAYFAFSQYMLIWYGNIPEETYFFIRRNMGSWNGFAIGLVVGRFFVPFLLLLPQGTKRNPKTLALAAGWVVLMQAAELYWLVLPGVFANGVSVGVLEFSIWAGMGCLLAGAFLRRLVSCEIFPRRDPRLQESLDVIG
ncbi:Quinol:cytochrome c oxidoreductase [Methylacidimicrobium sp. AP8]|uniref:hypothetical protein n=1 Tax=Methylacidimicrobium sp. AP8 TaxID=2730359 RepID=UPI0018C15CC0|nr:hypothetical protein [Methylacidimicrobium sp. AP8]CAB4244391.1 Quinol:cytochrome c oxidoreductase [Methylacidimicrobium sp. AP8]